MDPLRSEIKLYYIIIMYGMKIDIQMILMWLEFHFKFLVQQQRKHVCLNLV